MDKLYKFLGVDKKDQSLMNRIYFIFLCSGAVSTLTGAILPDIQASYNLSYELRGFMLSAQQVGNFSAVLLSGFLPYLIGRKQTAVLLPMGIVIALLLIPITGNPVLLVIAFILSGVGRGTLSNTTNVTVAECAKNKAGGLNFLHATFAVGAFISPFVAIALGASRWRVSSVLFAIVMLVSIILIGKSNLSSVKTPRKSSASVPFAKDFDFWNITLILMTYLCAESSMMGWLVTYFQESGLMSPSLAKTMQSLLWIMILVGRLICAVISNKLKNKNLLIISMGVLMTLCFVLMISTESTAVIIVALLGVGFFMSGIYPTTLSTQKSEYNSSTVATGTCIALGTVGGFVWPSVVGQIAASEGIKGGIASISVALLAMVILMVIKLFRGRLTKNI